MKVKKELALLIAISLCFGLTACGWISTESPSSAPTPSIPKAIPELTSKTPTQTTSITTYQSILDEYSEKIRAATPVLIDEYNEEAANNTDGLTGLAEISNDKIIELAEISNEGITKMAELMLYFGSGKYEEYQEWAEKLTDVYMEEAGKITDAYIKSAR